MFDEVIIVDWSARSAPSPRRPSADAIWLAHFVGGKAASEPLYLRTRAAAWGEIQHLCKDALRSGSRLLLGFDFPFGYPAGFAQALTGKADALAVWEWLAAKVDDHPDNSNHRFELAAEINGRFPGVGPFWGHPHGRVYDGLPPRGTLRTGHGLPERRAVETVIRSAQPCWKLFTTGSVGSQVLLGLPGLHRLRMQFGEDMAIWPFQTPDRPLVVAEIYPSILDAAVNAALSREGGIKDAHQVRLLAERFAQIAPQGWEALFAASPDNAVVRCEEGWILGVGADGQVLI